MEKLTLITIIKYIYRFEKCLLQLDKQFTLLASKQWKQNLSPVYFCSCSEIHGCWPSLTVGLYFCRFPAPPVGQTEYCDRRWAPRGHNSLSSASLSVSVGSGSSQGLKKKMKNRQYFGYDYFMYSM